MNAIVHCMANGTVCELDELKNRCFMILTTKVFRVVIYRVACNAAAAAGSTIHDVLSCRHTHHD